MTTFTVEEIRKYLLKQDSMGDIMYNLSEENIIAANKPYPGYRDDDDAKEELSECCAEPIERGICTLCKEFV
jgi:hypothetical protein